MENFFRTIRIIALGFVAIMLTSCLDNKYDKKEEEAQEKLDNYLKQNNYTSEQNIGYGIYVKILKASDASKPKPLVGNTVLMDYDGFKTDGVLFETTDSTNTGGISDDAVSRMIFGPKRHKIGSLIFGLDTALRTLREGEHAEIVIPHRYAYGNAEPVVYNVKLIEVIKSDTVYETKIFNEFIAENGFYDSVNISSGLLYKFITDDTLKVKRKYTSGDLITLKITARYAENYYNNKLGRMFYPRAHESATIDDYIWGSPAKYPIINAIDSAIKYMDQGEIIEIAFKSGAEAPAEFQWGYGDGGVTDDKYFKLIISAYTPLHYRIEIDTIKQ